MAEVSTGKVRKYGTREEVFNGTAQQTKGGLTKSDLFEDKGRFVSRRASDAVKQRAPLKKKETEASEDEDTPPMPGAGHIAPVKETVKSCSFVA